MEENGHIFISLELGRPQLQVPKTVHLAATEEVRGAHCCLNLATAKMTMIKVSLATCSICSKAPLNLHKFVFIAFGLSLIPAFLTTSMFILFLAYLKVIMFRYFPYQGFLPVWHPIFLPPIFGAFPRLPASLCSFLAFRRIEARYFFAVSLNFQFCSYRGPGTGTHGLDIGLNWELPRRIAFTLVVAGLRVKMFHYFPYQGFLPVKLSAQ